MWSRFLSNFTWACLVDLCICFTGFCHVSCCRMLSILAEVRDFTQTLHAWFLIKHNEKLFLLCECTYVFQILFFVTPQRADEHFAQRCLMCDFVRMSHQHKGTFGVLKVSVVKQQQMQQHTFKRSDAKIETWDKVQEVNTTFPES